MQEKTTKQVVVSTWDESKKYWMADDPDHYHKWEDQTFHIVEGELDAKIGDEHFHIRSGDSIHCPRGVSHYLINTGDNPARLISYIFPGEWAEAFMAETSRQNKTHQQDFELIERKFGVVYV